MAEKVTMPGLSPEQFSQLLDMLGSRSASDPGLAAAIKELATQQSRTVRQSNAFHPGKSAFSYPEGNEARPKPRLAREVFFCGVRQEEDQLTPIEIDLYNQIASAKRSRGDTWTADIDRHGRLLILIPHASYNERMEIPNGLHLVLMEFIGGQDAIDPNVLGKEVLELRRQVVELAIANEKIQKDMEALVA